MDLSSVILPLSIVRSVARAESTHGPRSVREKAAPAEAGALGGSPEFCQLSTLVNAH